MKIKILMMQKIRKLRKWNYEKIYEIEFSQLAMYLQGLLTP